MVDKDMIGTKIESVPVVFDVGDATEFLLQEWVDKVFNNLEELEPYRKELAEWRDYTVINSSSSIMTIRQVFIKRTIDILARWNK